MSHNMYSEMSAPNPSHLLHKGMEVKFTAMGKDPVERQFEPN